MKTALVRFITLTALFSLFTFSARAEANALTQIVKERDAVLSEIVASYEAQFTAGMSDGEDLTSAQMALCAFRRDTALTVPDKIKQQELIVQVYDKKIATVKSRMSTGIATRLDLLTATNSLLLAKQTLEELKLSGKKS